MTFMCVGELGGNCPIHGRRGTAHGGVKRHACGCPMLKGEKQLTADDVLATLANADLAEEESTPLTPEEKEAFGIKDCSVCGDPLEENGDSDTCQTNRSPAKDSPDVG